MIHIKYDSFSFISVCFISTIRYITNSQWPALQLARLAQWIERPVMAKGQGSIPGQAWIFQILFEPLRSLILLRRSCSLSMSQFVWKSQVRLVQSWVEFQYWSGLNYERSPFFLVRWAKRTRHENNHAGDWRRGLRARALPSLNLKRETARGLEVSPNISWKDKNFVFKITRPARQPVLTFGKRPCRGQYSLNKGLLASMIERQSKHVTTFF